MNTSRNSNIRRTCELIKTSTHTHTNAHQTHTHTHTHTHIYVYLYNGKKEWKKKNLNCWGKTKLNISYSLPGPDQALWHGEFQEPLLSISWRTTAWHYWNEALLRAYNPKMINEATCSLFAKFTLSSILMIKQEIIIQITEEVNYILTQSR